MAAQTLYRINLTSRERSELQRLERGHTTSQHIAKRARIILLANEEGMSNQEIATRLGITKPKFPQCKSCNQLIDRGNLTRRSACHWEQVEEVQCALLKWVEFGELSEGGALRIGLEPTVVARASAKLG